MGMIMKQQTNLKAVLAGAALLSLTAIAGVASGKAAWAVAGVLGFAALWACATGGEPKLAPVRVYSRTPRS
jgi:hypothetical protein